MIDDEMLQVTAVSNLCGSWRTYCVSRFGMMTKKPLCFMNQKLPKISRNQSTEEECTVWYVIYEPRLVDDRNLTRNIIKMPFKILNFGANNYVLLHNV
jgi:hypothetical protein